MDAAGWWAQFSDWATIGIAPGPPATARASDAFLDTVACILAGQPAPVARAVAQAAPADDPAMAALRLGTAAHALDFDDYDRPSVGHPSAVLVPAILAARPDATGAEAIAAYVVGIEAIDRLGEAMNPDHYARGWHATATLGAVGAAAAAGRLFGLDGRRMLNALSLGAGMAAGLKAQFGSGAKPVNAGQAAMHGVLAAQLARAGVDARVEALVALAAMTGPGTPRPLRPFGAPLAIEEHGLVVKLWPCCGYLGRAVPAAIALHAAGVRTDDVRALTLTAPPRNAAVIAYGIPATPDQARFSAPYCLAAALSQGRLGLDDFSDAAIRRADVIALARRITLTASAHQGPGDLVPEDPDILTLTLTDGRVIERVLGPLPGSPEAPATRAQLHAKLVDCAGGRLPSRAFDREYPSALVAVLDDLPTRATIAPIGRWIGMAAP